MFGIQINNIPRIIYNINYKLHGRNDIKKLYERNNTKKLYERNDTKKLHGRNDTKKLYRRNDAEGKTKKSTINCNQVIEQVDFQVECMRLGMECK